MKRATSLFNQIIDYENIRFAWLKARKRKNNKPVVQKFARNVNENLQMVQKNLKANPPVLSSYSQFTIFDPKERVISVVPFIDRVMHHAIMNVLEPIFEKNFIYHTYACRKNKGTHKAVKYVYRKTKKCSYFLKLDVRKYFDTIDHQILKRMLCRIIKDKRCLSLLFEVIDSYGSSLEGKGLPIGNLTSQFFANFYLSALDHYVLEQMKPQAYVRYMDDMLVLGNSKSELKKFLYCIEKYCNENLNLELKPFILGECKNGIPFLGYLILKTEIKLTQKSRKRKKKKLRLTNYEYEQSIIDEQKYVERVKMLY